MATPRWDLPLPTYERDVNATVRIYRNAISRVILILQDLATHGQADKTITRAQMTAVMNQLSTALAEVDREAEAYVREEVEKAFIAGQSETVLALGDAKTIAEATAKASMTELSRNSIDALIADTFEDLLYANNKMKRETIKMVRNMVAESMKTSRAMNQGVNFTKKSILERFAEEGNIAIVDRRGRNWKLEQYAEMVTRTKLHQAHTEGTRVEALERDVDLAIISSHGAEDECRHFEGQVISMNGNTPGFMTYDELRRSNLIFHPNCKHKVTPVRDVSLLPTAVRRKFEQGQKEAQERLKKQKNK